MKNSNQRISLTDAQDFAVRQIALKEGRQFANVLARLVDEGLANRRKADSDISKLVEVLRSKAPA